MMKNMKGITLVTLVITIIILLMLAGISIKVITNTGLFEKAREARKQNEISNIPRSNIFNELYKSQ